MRAVGLSNSIWRLALTAVALVAAAILALELGFAIKPTLSGQHGSLGYHFFWGGSTRGTSKILGLDDASPLVSLGAAVGDTIVLDRVDDDLTDGFVAGAPVGLTLVHNGVATHHVIEAVATPNTTTFELRYFAGLLGRALCLLFALLIGFKQPGSRIYRALALYFVLSAFNGRAFFVPSGALRTMCDLFYWCTFIPASYLVLRFAVLYPNDQPAGLRAAIAARMGLIRTAVALMNCYVLWFATGHDAPLSYLFPMLFVVALTVTLLAALVDGWHSSTGAERQRHIWLLVAIGGANFFSLLTGLPINWRIGAVRVVDVLGDASTLLMEIGIAYAVLRHRVFNFGFAVNRAIFYSAASAVLLIAFGIVEWLSEHFLHFEAREANILIDGAIALGVYLAFHKIKHALEHGLERLFFHKWHQNEAALRQFIKKAAHISAAPDLIASFQHELQRFSGGANCVIYQRNAHGDYEAFGQPVNSSTKSIGKNDDISVSLMVEQTPITVARTDPRHAHQLALPMHHRGTLHGIVLLDPKANGDDYRPDEAAVLAFATHQIGLDLHALKNETLTAALDGQAKRIALDAVRLNEQEDTINRMQQLLLELSASRLPREAEP